MIKELSKLLLQRAVWLQESIFRPEESFFMVPRLEPTWWDLPCCKPLSSSLIYETNNNEADKCEVELGGKVKTRSARRIFVVRKAI